MNETFRFSNRVRIYLTTLFNRFSDNNIQYCILHSYEKLPDYSQSDVDMAVSSADLEKAEAIIFDVSHSLGFKVLQKLYYDIPRCYYYIVFFRDDDGSPGFIQLDFLNDDYGIGSYILKTNVLLEGRRQFKNFYIPSVPVEACYLLIKKILKGKFLPEHEAKLKALFEEGGKAVTEMVGRYFGSDCMDDIKTLIQGTGTSKQASIIGKLRRCLSLRQLGLKPHLHILGLFWLSKRILGRILSPTGLITIFISPDGGGKSTVTDLLLHRLRFAFRNVKKMHWRPYFLPPPRKILSPGRWKEREAPNYDPHGLPPKGMIDSSLRSLYYFCDYLLGYFPKAYWPKIRTHLIVFERYYYDLLIDAKRFRLNVPSWLPALFLHFVPKGDMVFVLTGPPQVFYQRKQEIPLDEIERQLRSIDHLSARLHSVCKVSIDQSVDKEVSRIEDLIVDQLEKRLKKRMGNHGHG